MDVPIVNEKGEPITKELLAYIAGFFDGEGCITVSRRNSSGCRYSIICIITQKKREVLDLIKSYFGGYIVIQERNRRENDFICRLRFSPLASREFLEAIEPYLIVKKEQAQIAIEYHQSRMISKLNKNGYYHLSEDAKEYEANTVRILHKLKKKQISQAFLIPTQDESIINSYVAGVFDAEGCVNVSKREKHGKYKSIDHYVRCTVTQEIRLLVEYMQSLFSGCVHISCRRKSNDGKKIRNVYRWQVTHRKALEFMKKIEGFLIIKKKQVELGIEVQNSHAITRGKDVWLTEETISKRDAQKQSMHRMKRLDMQLMMAVN